MYHVTGDPEVEFEFMIGGLRLSQIIECQFRPHVVLSYEDKQLKIAAFFHLYKINV